MTPKYKQEFTLNNIGITQFLVVLDEAIKFLKWELNYISEQSISASTSNGIFSANYLIKVKINEGSATISSESTGSELFDFGKNKKNVLALIDQIEFQLLILKPEEIEEKFAILAQHLIVSKEDLEVIAEIEKPASLKDILFFFLPRPSFFITPIIVNINILIFIAMLIAGANIFKPSADILINWGANLRSLTANGQLWRVITSTFLHIGIIHLVMNMFALAYIGALLEPIIGKYRFLAAYLFSGIIAGIASAWWHEASVSAGASGAIFGLFGTFLALLISDIIEKSAKKSLFISLGTFVVYNLLYGLKGDIDNAAHLGGLVTGFFIGIALIPGLKKDSALIKSVTIGMISFYVIVIMAVAKFTLPKESEHGVTAQEMNSQQTNLSAEEIKYKDLMTDFISMDQMAFNFTIDSTVNSKEQILSDIKNIGIYYLKRNLELVDSIDSLHLDQAMETKSLFMRKYCTIGIEMYKLLYKAVDENSKAYDKQVNDYIKQMKDIKQQASKLPM